MVKNLTGGNKHKGMARKAFNASKSHSKLRKIEEEGEVYAVVVKILGGSRCCVLGMDKVERDCIIRGKFRGSKKRDNTVRPGVVVLVGDRDWASNVGTDKNPVCDLLEVYNDIDKERLKTVDSSIDWTFTNGVGDVASSTTVVDDFEFTDQTIDEEYKRQVEDDINGKTIGMDFGHEEEIDIDDI